ncbi:MAG: glycosyltransferase [Oscillospiraceae bacterium]|nr:glycosyltransferase [Oscillospiraceae bacterium]
MHIIYAATTCSAKTYERLFSDVKIKPAFQSQKYHRLLIEGLAANAKVDVVANPPVNRSVMAKPFLAISDETEGGARYHNMAAIRNPVLKLIWVALTTFFKTLALADKDSAVVVDCLNCTAALFAQQAARLRGVRCVGIITDLPDMLMNPASMFARLSNYIIRHCTDYVLLTEAMNDYLGNTTKPYVVLEGHADVSMRENVPSLDRKLPGRVCLYAGGVSRQYGLPMLVEGFRMADIPDARLHIYGPGDYVEELQAVAQEDSRVYYGGMLLNTQIVDKEMEATLLVNPRPNNAEYVKYSFPSKTMEYMSAGTPVLMTKLPGMPKEYYPYVYLIEEETPEGIAAALKQVFSNSDTVLFQRGCAAREFVLEERNNVIQASRILKMLELDV